jgi:hypothetical protein
MISDHYHNVHPISSGMECFVRHHPQMAYLKHTKKLLKSYNEFMENQC